jgi:hypothetical protein
VISDDVSKDGVVIQQLDAMAIAVVGWWPEAGGSAATGGQCGTETGSNHFFRLLHSLNLQSLLKLGLTD